MQKKEMLAKFLLYNTS